MQVEVKSPSVLLVWFVCSLRGWWMTIWPEATLINSLQYNYTAATLGCFYFTEASLLCFASQNVHHLSTGYSGLQLKPLLLPGRPLIIGLLHRNFFSQVDRPRLKNRGWVKNLWDGIYVEKDCKVDSSSGEDGWWWQQIYDDNHCQREDPNMLPLKCAQLWFCINLDRFTHCEDSFQIHHILCDGCNLLQSVFNRVCVCFPWNSDRRLIWEIWQGRLRRTSGCSRSG